MQILLTISSYLLIFIVKFTSSANIPSQSGGKCNSVCTTLACTKEAEFFMKYMNPTADPCDDFYQFVCGNYIKETPIPEDKGGITHLHAIEDKIRNHLISELKAPVDPSDLKAIKNVKTYYRNCLDEAAIEKLGVAPLVELIDELGGWPVVRGNAWNEKDYKWQNTMSNVSKQGFLPDFPVELSVGYDDTNSSSYILQVYPAETIIDESFFAPGSKSLEAYETMMIEVAVLLGATRESATAELKECTQFEVELHMIKLTPAALDILSPVDNRQTVKILSGKYSDVPWLDILDRLLNPSNVYINEDEILHVEDPLFVSKIGKLIAKTPKRVLANYQIWKVIYQLIDYLPRSFRSHKFNLYKATLGLQKEAQRDQVCFDLLQASFETAVGAMYVKKYFDKKSKDRANEIIQYIRNEFESSLHKVQWMDERTRKKALEKIHAMKSSVGYPDEITNDQKIENIYKDLEITSGNFVEGYRKLSNHTKNLNLNALRQSVNEVQWIFETNVAVANAYYDRGKNEIRMVNQRELRDRNGYLKKNISFPGIIAGILQQPLFKFDRPDYLNYGGIGYIMGHEITHGFDSTGRKYDGNGNYNDWWDEKTAIEFENRVSCLVHQYNQYVVTQINQKMDGNRTKGENIADGGGFKLAYRAYQKFINTTGKTEQCLPDLDYSPQQMFWISAGSVMCSKVTDEIMRILLIDEHSPFEARINVAFSNIQEFSNDFGCPLGSKMNPEDKCIVW